MVRLVGTNAALETQVEAYLAAVSLEAEILAQRGVLQWGMDYLVEA